MWHESRILNRALLKAGKMLIPGLVHLDSGFEDTTVFTSFNDIEKKQGFIDLVI